MESRDLVVDQVLVEYQAYCTGQLSERLGTTEAPDGAVEYCGDEDDPAHPVSVENHHVGRWHFITLRRQVDNSRDIADLDINLDQLPDKDRTVIKHGLVGTLTVTEIRPAP